MGIDLYYHPTSPPSRTVLLLAKHLNLDLNVKFLDLFKGEQFTPEFLAMNPQHSVPTLVDHDNHVTIYEGRAVVVYLQTKYGHDESLYPKEPEQRAKVDMRLYFDAASLYPRFRETCYPFMFENHHEPTDQHKRDKLNEMLGFVEVFLKDGDFISGKQLTIADFSYATSLATIEACHGLANFPKTRAYLEKCKSVMRGYDELNQKGADEFGRFCKDALAKLADKDKLIS